MITFSEIFDQAKTLSPQERKELAKLLIDTLEMPPEPQTGKPAEHLRIRVAGFTFVARMEVEAAPQTCAAFRALLPYHQQLIHARWSGEACWIPLGDFQLNVSSENHTSYPSRGDILFYPGGISETEILFPYGSTRFASKVGQLAGNHFLTVIDGMEHLAEVGRMCLWQGAQDIVFEMDTTA